MTVPAHIEAFLRGVDAINRLDVNAVLSLTHEECVFEPLRSQTEGAFVGHEGMRRFLDDTAQTFEMFKATTRTCATSGMTACSRSARFGCAGVRAASRRTCCPPR